MPMKFGSISKTSKALSHEDEVNVTIARLNGYGWRFEGSVSR